MKKRSYWLSVALILTVVFSFLVPPESIEARQNQVSDVEGTSKKVSSESKPQMYIIPTSDPKKADEVMKQLERGKSPKELGLISDQQHASRKQTLQQMASEAAKSKKIYPVSVDNFKTAAEGDDWTPPVFEYDDIQFDACVENDQSSEGWIKNHYSYCWSNYIVYSDPAGCGPSPFPFFCDWVSFRLTVIGNSMNGARTVFYNYTVDDIDMDFDSKGWIGSKVSVSIQCDGISETRDCLGDDSPTTRTLAQWKSNDDGSTLFDSDPPPITAGNKDQISYMDLWPRVTVDPPGNKYPPITNDGPKEKIRMDSADYLFVFNPNFYPKEGAVFANVQPVFFYDMDKPYFSVMKEAFQHHKDALTSPGSLIPGVEGRPPLTRLYSKYDPAQHAANRKAKDAACSKLSKPEGYECDEFPFASTYEGAGAGDGRFSVRYIPRAANNTHGRWLGAWYAYDRILHKDPFYIGFK
ncbi:NucA/NucB deoxyribonuclease domain-containing protein [Metabacillus dongyingensis]|uniref:NucA/NucB deoxyribonuclease domain-containing protein n=1 Tax=Metabacillus dongyingensis TaxID=2874282 RepID=UPI003B8B20F6